MEFLLRAIPPPKLGMPLYSARTEAPSLALAHGVINSSGKDAISNTFFVNVTCHSPVLPVQQRW